MIKSGKFGAIKWDPNGDASPTDLQPIISLNTWKLSQKTDKINVTCFGDRNKVYVVGLPDISGTITGFWNSSSLELFSAVYQDEPGLLQLIPNDQDEAGSPLVVPAFEGLAYLDVDVDTSVEGAPALSSSFVAGGPWNLNLLD